MMPSFPLDNRDTATGLDGDSPHSTLGNPPTAAVPQAGKSPQQTDDEAVLAPPTEEEVRKPPSKFWLKFQDMSPWLGSSLLHAIILILLALFLIPGKWGGEGPSIDGSFSSSSSDLDLQAEELESLGNESPEQEFDATLVLEHSNPMDVTTINPLSLDPFKKPSNPSKQVGTKMGFGKYNGVPASYSNRIGDRRRKAALIDGTQESEEAVERGLAWLAAHQFVDGSWRFNFRDHPQCNGTCNDSGILDNTTGATGLAVLSYLGAGYTHKQGPYQTNVARGLYYLQSRMRKSKVGGDFREGSMYAHAITTIALCEAYSMTGDRSLQRSAQMAVEFTLYAQHESGGWRYDPKQPGDTTVTGWQLMALKSAQNAGIEIPSPVWERIARFLDSKQTSKGSFYGYLTPGRASKENATRTSVGLLSRMMLGWKHDHRPLKKGVAYLSKLGPSDHDMYYNYYATQVMHHYRGAYWSLWNKKLREYLINSQAKQGHEAGSWQFTEHHSRNAGRLYNTTMAIMTLEVYYRYLPLYGENVVNRRQ